MTGLDVTTDVLLEIAAIATDKDLERLDDGISLVIKTEQATLDAMGEWCQKQHAASHLIQRCQEAEQSMAQVEDEVMGYVRSHFPDGKALLAGSSVHADKAFIVRCANR